MKRVGPLSVLYGAIVLLALSGCGGPPEASRTPKAFTPSPGVADAFNDSAGSMEPLDSSPSPLASSEVTPSASPTPPPADPLPANFNVSPTPESSASPTETPKATEKPTEKPKSNANSSKSSSSSSKGSGKTPAKKTSTPSATKKPSNGSASTTTDEPLDESDFGESIDIPDESVEIPEENDSDYADEVPDESSSDGDYIDIGAGNSEADLQELD